MQKTGLFGGSFNPVHTGHISLARHLLREAALDEVWLMVSPQNPLKPTAGLLDERLRYAMTERAVSDIEGVSASDYELHLPRPSYTWETLRQLSRDYPGREFVLIVGGDNWAHFQRWHRWQDILRHYRIVVYPRDGHPGTVSAPLLDVSSTEIRRRVSRGESIAGLVPDVIADDVRRYYGTK